MTLLIAEFCPGAALSYTRIDCLFDNGCADTAGGFNLFPIVVEAIRYDSFSAVFIGCDLLRGKGGCVLEIFVIGPVRAAMGRLVRYPEIWEGIMMAVHYFASLDMINVGRVMIPTDIYFFYLWGTY